MQRGWLGSIALLAVAAAAAAQDQRVFLFPQTSSVTLGNPAILAGMCLDPKIIGAPQTGEPITRFAKPENIVVRKLRGGEVVETRRWSEFDPRRDPPWVRFEGASNVTGRVAVRAITVRQEPGVTYEIEIIDGTAVCRPQESLTGLYLARLNDFDDSYGAITRDLTELRAAFPPNALVFRLFDDFARQTIYPGMHRDEKPAQLAEKARQFSKRFAGAFHAATPEVRMLLAAFVAGPIDAHAHSAGDAGSPGQAAAERESPASPDPGGPAPRAWAAAATLVDDRPNSPGAAALSPGQRAFFERHHILLDGPQPKVEQLEAVNQFRAIYAGSVLQACAALSRGEVRADAAGLGSARRALERLASWQRAGLRGDAHKIALAIAPAFRVTFREGQPLLSRDTDLKSFRLAEVEARLKRIQEALDNEKRRAALRQELAEVQPRVTPAARARLGPEFFALTLPDQALQLLLFGEESRGGPVGSLTRRLLQEGPPLGLALLAALREPRWLIDASDVEERHRSILAQRVESFAALSGIACVILDSETARQHLAGLTHESDSPPQGR